MFEIKKQLMWSKLKVGVVVTLTILILIATTFFAGGIEKIFSPKIEIKAHMKDVKGLRKGSPVWFSGIEIGSVKGIALHAEHGTIVTMSINKDSGKYIKKDSIATIQTIGLLGDKYIEIGLGSPAEKNINEGDIIRGAELVDIKDIVKTGFTTLSKITEFVEGLEGFIKRFEHTSAKITNSKLFTDPSLYDNLQETSRSLSLILKDFKESEGTLKKLINDPSLYDKALSAASSIEDFGKKVNEGEGSLKRLAEDPSVYENLSASSKKLSLILEKIESGEGVAGSLINDKELEREFRDAISDIKKLTADMGELAKDVKANPKKYFKFSIF